MSKSLPPRQPEHVVRYIDSTLQRFEEFDVFCGSLPFYGLIRWKVLSLLEEDIEKGGTAGTMRIQRQYLEELEKAFVKDDYQLEHLLLLQLCTAYQLPRFIDEDDIGQPVFNMTVKRFKKEMLKVLALIFRSIGSFSALLPVVADLLSQYEEERGDFEVAILEDDAAFSGRQAMVSFEEEYKGRPRAGGLTSDELSKAFKQSRKQHGGPTGYKDTEWSVGYRDESWTPEDDKKSDEDGLQMS